MASNAALLIDWKQDMLVRGRMESTVRSYTSAIRGFEAATKDKPWTQVTERDLKAYLALLRKNGIKTSTIKGNFAALSSMMDYLVHERLRPDNPVLPFRARYLDRVSSRQGGVEQRRLISIDEARNLVRSTMDIRTRALLALLLKTGIRREEASMIDVKDIDWTRQSITLKPHPKRTNNVVYFDDETGRLLKRWLALREARGGEPGGPLFINQRSGRLGTNGIYNLVTDAAQRRGLHDPKGAVRERFTPHCCRHWFTTHLRRAGMPDNMIAELRGDADARTLDIYTHVDHDELRDQYLTKIPRLHI